jgi:hypothetical protein
MLAQIRDQRLAILEIPPQVAHRGTARLR